MNTSTEKPRSSYLVHIALLLASAAIGYISINSIQEYYHQPIAHKDNPKHFPQRPPKTEAPASSSANSEIAAEPITANNFEESLQRILSLDSQRQIEWEIEAYFETLSKDEAPKIYALLKDHPKHIGYVPLLFQNWGTLDPLAALVAAESFEGIWKDQITKSTFQGWAKKDVHAAWQAASSYLSDKDGNKRNIGRPVMKEMIAKDPDFLLAIVNADTMHSSNSSIRSQMIDHAFESGQPEAMLQKLSNITRQRDRNEWTSRLFEKWAANNIDDALAHLDQFQEPKDADAAMEGFLRGWSKSDPQAALEYALSHRKDVPVKHATPQIINQYLHERGDSNIEALVAQITIAGALNEIGPPLAQALARTQPQKALTLLNQLEKSEQTQLIVSNALNSWSQKDFGAAQSFFMNLDTADRTFHLSSMVDMLFFQADGGERLDQLMNSVPASEERSALLNSLVERTPFLLNNGKDSYLKSLKKIALQSPDLTEANRKLLGSAAFEF